MKQEQVIIIIVVITLMVTIRTVPILQDYLCTADFHKNECLGQSVLTCDTAEHQRHRCHGTGADVKS